MNKTIISSAVLSALLLGTATAQRTPPSQDQLKERKAQKLEEAWWDNGNWITDHTVAKKAAKEEGKYIFAYFTRSYSP